MRAGIECTTEVKRGPKFKHLKRMFPEVNADAAEAFSRLYGWLNIVLGMESRPLHCSDGYKASKLRLNKSVFAPGWVLTGQAPAVGRKRKTI